MGSRAVRAPRTIVIALLALASAGCSGLLDSELYLLESAREAYFIYRFQGWDDQRWRYGAEYDYAPDFDIRGGRFIANDLRQFVATRDEVPGDLEIWLDWEVWHPLATQPADRRDNGDVFDFRIALHTDGDPGEGVNGPAVDLKLFDSSAAPAVDRLVVGEDAASLDERNLASATTVSTESVLLPRAGSLRVVFSRSSEPPTVSAEVFVGSADNGTVTLTGDAVLEVTREFSEPWAEEAHFVVETSGLLSTSIPDLESPRVLDRLYAFRPEVRR
ncbi:MAG: hypothetical protein ACOC0E_01190 [Spirochaetota bacterium]